MKKHFKVIKSVVALAVLPLFATAAVSAHQIIADDAPISVELDGVAAVQSDQLAVERIHTVALNRAGAVEGRIASINPESKEAVGLSALKIFFVQNGEVVFETTTNKEGAFTAEGIAEGAYSFVATGEAGFAAYGIRVIANDGSDQVNTMEVAAVSPRLAVVQQLLEAKLPKEVASQIVANGNSVAAEVVGANRVQLEDGTLTGRVIPILGDTKAVAGTFVHILRDQQQVAQVQADENGSFSVADMEPGVYDFVAAGPTGFAAVSFEAVAKTEVVASDSEEVPASAPIAYQDGFSTEYAGSLDVCLTCGNDVNTVATQYDYDISASAPIEYAGESVGCGGAAGGACGSCGDYSGFSSCGGGCGGGGGGFGGGGRGGRLLALAALGVGIAALAENDGTPNNPNNGSPNN